MEIARENEVSIFVGYLKAIGALMYKTRPCIHLANSLGKGFGLSCVVGVASFIPQLFVFTLRFKFAGSRIFKVCHELHVLTSCDQDLGISV